MKTGNWHSTKFLFPLFAFVMSFVSCSKDEVIDTPPEDKTSPVISVKMSEVDVFGGKLLLLENCQLTIGEDVVATWTSEGAAVKSVKLTFNGKVLSSGTILNEAGTISLTVTKENGKSASAKIILTNGLQGTESLKNISLYVGKETDLLKGLTFADGVSLVKTEIEMDGQRKEIAEPSHFTPEYPGVCSIIFTVKWKNNTTTDVRVDNITIKPLEYKSISITNLKPVDILPIVGQVEGGDKNAYNHIEHLRVAEATRIRDMMWKYGAGNHSPEQYQQLMMRLNTGMMQEYPKGYNNFEFIGTGEYGDKGSEHSHEERSIVNSLLNHTNLKCVYTTLNEMWQDKIDTFIKENPNTITILGCSAYAETDQEKFNQRSENEQVKELCKSGKLIIFRSGGNIHSKSGVLKNKSCHKDITGDEHGFYSLQANANGKNDANADIALLVTVGTNAEGDVDQTGEITASSAFPVGFHNKVLFSGRAFPYHSYNSGKIVAEGNGNNGKYATSYTNYVNVALMDLCFQMFAEVENVFELLEKVRATCLTNYMRLDLNGDGDTNDTYDGQPETQPLQLINPAGFFQKHLMPADLPAKIKNGETVALNKGYYKGVAFSIPGAEVNIDDEWMPFTKDNESLIKAHNPFALEWRINSSLLSKMGYKSGNTVKGSILVIDDQWNGLNIASDIAIQITE